ncbi:hypothetical protein [Pseudarthrobacter sp. MDT1-22]
MVGSLPAPLKEIIISSYNDALTPIFIWMVPLAVIAEVLMCFVKEKPLATAVEHDVLSETSVKATSSSRPTTRLRQFHGRFLRS